MTSVLWFRRDLRLHDLPALQAALEYGTVAPLFVIEEALIHGRWRSPNRVAFMLACLAELDKNLRLRGNQLHIRVGRPKEVLPMFAAEVRATDVFVSRDYTPYARRRDTAVQRALKAAGVGFHARRGTLIHEPEDVYADSGEPYSVFSPFFRRWQTLTARSLVDEPGVIPGTPGIGAGTLPTATALGLTEATSGTLETGEPAALRRLDKWAKTGLPGYSTGRDLLAADLTSRLSQDLRFGTLSPLQVVTAVMASREDAGKFVSEIAWRDFYSHVLWHNPRVLHEPFQPQFASLQWDNSPARLEAWRAGNTGYPVIDAAMRQLLATGYMHNRARMIVASFLTKDLHIDWRAGEDHFMAHLIDGDVASNNGGWQWAASTGTDPQPYFRIFNPLLQSQRFDPDGAYIRRWVPELANVPARYIHEPSKMSPSEQEAVGCVIGEDYPAPIVNHADERGRALAMYAAAKSEATRSG